MRRLAILGVIIAGLLLGMAATRWLTEPPAVRAHNGPGEFDAIRAKARLSRIIANSPAHPADSAGSDAVRGRLIEELRSLGFRPRIADRFACNSLRGQRGVNCARVRNIMVTLGEDPGKPHLLINSHYDSTAVGPGASDAGLGVAAMLETAALMRERPLGRPVTFLFNEGEEQGLIGARAFLDGDPLSQRVDALINLEARGTTGPVNMFETSLPNPAAIAMFRDSVERPVANSLAVSAYRLIPNYTDVNTFAEERRWLTLNFAPIGNETRYHSPGDNLAALDLATLQHMGDQLVQTSARLAAGTPTQGEGETLFTSIGTRFLLTMPMALGIGLAVLALLLLLRSVWKERAWGALALLTLALAAATGLAWAGLSLLGLLREGQFWRANPRLLELAINAGAIAAGLAALGASRSRPAQLRAAWWLLFLILGLVLTVFASGALILFLLPPLVYALAALSRSEGLGRATNLVAAAVLFITLGAVLGLLQDLLSNGPFWVFGLIGGMVLMPWLIEARPLLEAVRKRRLWAAALVLAGLAWLPAALAPAYSSDRQQQWTLQYVVDGAQRQPVWAVVNDRKLLPAQWRQFGDWRLGTLPFSQRQRWIAPAPPVSGLTPARLIPAGVEATPGGRLLRFRVEANGSDDIDLSAPADADVRAMGVPGQMRRPVKGTSGRYVLGCTGRSCDGQTLQLLVGPQPVELLVTDTRWSLPVAARSLQAARPRLARPQYVPDSTVLVSRLRG